MKQSPGFKLSKGRIFSYPLFLFFNGLKLKHSLQLLFILVTLRFPVGINNRNLFYNIWLRVVCFHMCTVACWFWSGGDEAVALAGDAFCVTVFVFTLVETVMSFNMALFWLGIIVVIITVFCVNLQKSVFLVSWTWTTFASGFMFIHFLSWEIFVFTSERAHFLSFKSDVVILFHIHFHFKHELFISWTVWIIHVMLVANELRFRKLEINLL